jgi:mannitol PTS system EIICBA or EIICB component
VSHRAARARIQRVGAFLSGMIVPNIAAFLAWGLLTAIAAPGGWLPNARLAVLISPMLLTLLPILIGFSGGRLVYGVRGGVVGAVATMGAIAASTVPMFIGAMVLGPAGGWAIRELDRRATSRFPASLQMLALNFSGGICGALLAAAALVLVGPAVQSATRALGAAAHALTSAGLLPLVALVIEPGKVLFLNNAINHGVLSPLGAAQAHAEGQSLFFLLETNPGPGLGLLLACWFFGGGMSRQSAPGAVIVHFFGGIHEIYFPYVLMQPLTILALMAGGIVANATFAAAGAGLVATPSPGSIFAELAMAPRGGMLPVVLGIAAGTVASFVVAVPLVRAAAGRESPADLADATARSRALKLAAAGTAHSRSIVFACDAGMGSSVIGASVLARRLREANIDADVTHAAIGELPQNAAIVVVHASLEDRARRAAPHARIYAVDDFIHSPAYDAIIDALRPSAVAETLTSTKFRGGT